MAALAQRAQVLPIKEQVLFTTVRAHVVHYFRLASTPDVLAHAACLTNHNRTQLLPRCTVVERLHERVTLCVGARASLLPPPGAVPQEWLTVYARALECHVLHFSNSWAM